MGENGEDRRGYAPDTAEVLAAVESLERPSPLEAVAAAVDAKRRPPGRTGEGHDGGARASVEAVLARLTELEDAVQVKAYAPKHWLALGIRTDGAADSPKLWWSVAKWRDAAASQAHKDQVDQRREEARREAARTRGDSPVRDGVEAVLEQRRQQYLEWNTLQGPGAG